MRGLERKTEGRNEGMREEDKEMNRRNERGRHGVYHVHSRKSPEV